MEGNIIVWVGLGGTMSGIIFGYLGYKKGLVTDHYEQGSEAQGIKKDIQHISATLTRLETSISGVNETIRSLIEKSVATDQSTKAAHKRLDKQESKCIQCQHQLFSKLYTAGQQKETQGR